LSPPVSSPTGEENLGKSEKKFRKVWRVPMKGVAAPKKGGVRGEKPGEGGSVGEHREPWGGAHVKREP